MTRQAREISESDLHAWVDGALDGERRTQVEAWLHENPDARHRAKAYARQNAGLHALFDPILRDEVPGRLGVEAIRSARRGRWARGGRLGLVQAIAATLLLVLGGAAGWFLNDAIGPGQGLQGTLAYDAVSAHRVYVSEVRHPVEVGVSEEAHLVGWLSKRFGVSIKPPRLDAVGYGLMGGRLLPADGELAAQFMYQDQNGRRVTLYVRQNSGNRDTAFRFAENDQFRAFYWVDGPLGYALVGDLSRDRLLKTARIVYATLNE
jgi:anti-sigma factor RsiW